MYLKNLKNSNLFMKYISLKDLEMPSLNKVTEAIDQKRLLDLPLEQDLSPDDLPYLRLILMSFNYQPGQTIHQTRVNYLTR